MNLRPAGHRGIFTDRSYQPPVLRSLYKGLCTQQKPQASSIPGDFADRFARSLRARSLTGYQRVTDDSAGPESGSAGAYFAVKGVRDIASDNVASAVPRKGFRSPARGRLDSDRQWTRTGLSLTLMRPSLLPPAPAAGLSSAPGPLAYALGTPEAISKPGSLRYASGPGRWVLLAAVLSAGAQ